MLRRLCQSDAICQSSEADVLKFSFTVFLLREADINYELIWTFFLEIELCVAKFDWFSSKVHGRMANFVVSY
jgi:hypothetical protein